MDLLPRNLTYKKNNMHVSHGLVLSDRLEAAIEKAKKAEALLLAISLFAELLDARSLTTHKRQWLNAMAILVG